MGDEKVVARYKGLTTDILAVMSLYDRINSHARMEKGHLIWHGTFDARGFPRFSVTDNGKKINYLPRRYLFMQEYPDVKDPWVTNDKEKCDNKKCVLPAHQKDVSKRNRGMVRVPNRVRRIKNARAELVRKLTDENFTVQEIAFALNISRKTISSILRTKSS